jgi:hypothetical protein
MASKSLPRVQSKQRAVAEAATRHAHKALRTGFTQFFTEAAQVNPRGSLNRTVEAYLSALRAQLERHERIQAAQVRS